MSWQDYFRLLEKYDGDLSKATKSEMKQAFMGNPNDPVTARRIAEDKWGEYILRKEKEVNLHE